TPAILLPQRDATLTVATRLEHRLSPGLLLALLASPVLVGGWLLCRRRSGLPALPGNRRESTDPLDSGLAGILRSHRDALLLATELAHHHPEARRLAVVTHLHSLVWLLEAAVSEERMRSKVRERIETMANDSLEVDLPRSEQVLRLARLLRFDEGRIRAARIAAQRLAHQIRALQARDWSVDQIALSHPDMRKFLDALDSDLHAIRHLALAFVSVPLERELRSAINAVADKVERGHVNLSVQADPEASLLTVRAFRGDLATVIEELLSNALRALEGSESRRIVLQIRCHRKFAILSVQDTGCGIPVREQHRIFEAGISTRADGGTGLHACRRILDPLGASLQLAHSAEGEGTTMELRVRLEQSSDRRREGDNECRQESETAQPRALQSS
ncbi:MAG: GHKL domain-containing protein, partial [Candidatus Eisenbacteria bacterium]|nr:GHKL domain-containing protein [Candidatus Eisenbacteria bacterium]